MTTSIDELIYFSILDNIFINNISNIINNYNNFEIEKIVKKQVKNTKKSVFFCIICNTDSTDVYEDMYMESSCGCTAQGGEIITQEQWDYEHRGEDEDDIMEALQERRQELQRNRYRM